MFTPVRKRYKKVVILSVIIFLFLFVIAPVADAQEFVPISDAPIYSGIEKGQVPTLNNYLNGVFTFVLGIAAVLAVINIALGGLNYMAASGSGAIGEAKNQIWSAVKGLLIILATYILLYQINPDILKFRLGGSEVNEVKTQTETQ